MSILKSIAGMFSAEAEQCPPTSELPSRNQPCWCGSGQKYKKCHYTQDSEKAWLKGACCTTKA